MIAFPSLPALLISLTILWALLSVASGRVFMVLLDDDPVVSLRSTPDHPLSDDRIRSFKANITHGHDDLLQSLLPAGSYRKLYSYTHLINGFAIHTRPNQIAVLRNATGVRLVHDDVRVAKQTTHTPDMLGIPKRLWSQQPGGAQESGAGVVIGVIDTGINPAHPSFAGPTARGNGTSGGAASNGGSNRTAAAVPGTSGGVAGGFRNGKFHGVCETGHGFPVGSCNGKIVGARHFLRAARRSDNEYNVTLDSSPFDRDGHGSHAASVAAGNYHIPVVLDGYNYGNASGMAPGARIAVYKAMNIWGGFMSDVVAAVDQAAEDGVDIMSLSFTPSSIPRGPASYLNILDMELLFAVRAGIFVVQPVGNHGPEPNTVLSFSPWVMSVAASTVDRAYNNCLLLANGMRLPGSGISSPTTPSVARYPLAAAADVSSRNASFVAPHDCLSPGLFIRPLVRGKIIICTNNLDDHAGVRTELSVFRRMAQNVMAAGGVGIVAAADPARGAYRMKADTLTLSSEPGIVVSDLESAQALWDYYNANTFRLPNGYMRFRARAAIMDGREAVYTVRGPVVSSFSSRGPAVDNSRLEAADVLKPNVLAPGSAVWAAWSPVSQSDELIRGQHFAFMSGTSVAAPHVAGIAAMIKQRHPDWSPAVIASAIMTTANISDLTGAPILAQKTPGASGTDLVTGTPFDFGAGFVDPQRAMDPGLVFDAEFKHYVRFLCAVPGIDEVSVRRAAGVGCPGESAATRSVRNPGEQYWCSDLNVPSITVANMIGGRRVERRVTSVGEDRETYQVVVREPAGVTVDVSPKVFTISPGATRMLHIDFQPVNTSDAFAFGELLLIGDRKHEVRMPMAVFVTSVLKTN